MEALSYVVLILLTLAGYSGGASGRAGRGADIKPTVADLGLVALIWAGALYSRISLDINRWLLIVAWVAVAALAGIVSVWIRGTHRKVAIASEEEGKDPRGLIRAAWIRWKNFSKRMGSFQSRVILSFFYFFLISPFALAVKAFSDPLRIKKSSASSHWVPKKEMTDDLEACRRQF